MQLDYEIFYSHISAIFDCRTNCLQYSLHFGSEKTPGVKKAAESKLFLVGISRFSTKTDGIEILGRFSALLSTLAVLSTPAGSEYPIIHVFLENILNWDTHEESEFAGRGGEEHSSKTSSRSIIGACKETTHKSGV